MHNENLSSDEQKIMELLFSNEPANDLLAFELIKQFDFSDVFYLPLICISLVSQNSDFRSDVYKYLESKLNLKHKEYLSAFQQYLDSNKSNLPTFHTSAEPPFFSFEPSLFTKKSSQKIINDYFSNKEISDLIYFYATRTGLSAISFFDYNEDGNKHPRRLKMLKVFWEDKYQSGLKMPKLFTDEMELLFENFVLKLSNRQRLKLRLHLSDLRENKLPANILNHPYYELILKGKSLDECITYFSPYVFEFKKRIYRLILSIRNVDVLPKDWSRSSNIEKITIHAHSDCKFSDFDFLNTVNGLKLVKIYGGQLSHPDILLEKKNYNFSISFTDIAFSYAIGYNLGARKHREFSGGLYLINNSKLSMDEKRKYFNKVLTRAYATSDISAFSMEELEVLLVTDNEHVKKIITREINNRNNKTI